MKINVKKWVPRRYAVGSFGILSSVVLLTSCGDKDKGDGVPSPGDAAYPERQLKVASADERAQQLSLLKLVPADAEAVVAVYDLPYLLDSIENSNIGGFLKGNLSDLSGVLEEIDIVDVEDEADAREVIVADAVVSAPSTDAWADECPVKELVIVSGKGKLPLITALSKDMSTIVASLTEGDLLASMINEGMDDEAMEQLVLGLLPKLEFLKQFDWAPGTTSAPLMIMADLKQDAALSAKTSWNQLQALAGMFSGGMAAAYNIKVGTTEFSGLRLDGKMLSQMLKSQGGMIPVDPTVVANFADGLAKGSLYLLAGFKDDVFILSICTNPEKQLVLPSKPSDSILGKKEVDFADQYLDKKASFACYMSPAYSKNLVDAYISYCETSKGFTAKTVNELNKQIKTMDMARINKDIDTLYNFDIDTLKKADVSNGLSMYGWYDKGLRVEWVGGIVAGKFDWENPASYSAAVEMPDAVLALSSSTTQEYGQRLTGMIESAGSLYWNIFMPVMLIQTDGMDEDLQKVNTVAAHIASTWELAKSLQPSFRNKGVFVVDLKGKVDVEKLAKQTGDEISADDAKIFAGMAVPRVAMAQGLNDRSKLAPAWEQFRTSTNDLLVKMDVKDFKLEEPSSEQKDGYTSYYYDCNKLMKEDKKPKPGFDVLISGAIGGVPAVTLNDQLYLVGSDRNFNYEVAGACKTSATVPADVYGPMAVYMKVNFAPLVKAVSELDAAAKESGTANKEAIGKISQINSFFKALGSDLRGLQYTVTKENGKAYTRLHVEASGK